MLQFLFVIKQLLLYRYVDQQAAEQVVLRALLNGVFYLHSWQHAVQASLEESVQCQYYLACRHYKNLRDGFSFALTYQAGSLVS